MVQAAKHHFDDPIDVTPQSPAIKEREPANGAGDEFEQIEGPPN